MPRRRTALAREPEAPESIEVVRIETFERFGAARELHWDAFCTPEDKRAKNRARLREDFEESQRLGIPVGFLATLDGRPAGTALAIPSDRGVFLIEGSTAEWARGRGVYRALVRARWDFAVARATPALGSRPCRTRRPRSCCASASKKSARSGASGIRAIPSRSGRRGTGNNKPV